MTKNVLSMISTTRSSILDIFVSKCFKSKTNSQDCELFFSSIFSMRDLYY